MNNQAFSKIGLIVILVVLVAGGILTWQFLLSSKDSEMPEQETNQDGSLTKENEIANWKTYTNEKYGYEIKYPEDWYLNEWPNKNHTGFRTYSDNVAPKLQDSLITIEIEDASSLDNWISQFNAATEEAMQDLGMNFFQEEITIGPETGYKIGYREVSSGLEMTVSIALYRPGYVFIFNQSSPIECSELQCDTFNQMLSTFKFIEIEIPEEEQGVESHKIEDYSSAEWSYDDFMRVHRKNLILNALYFYFNDYGDYPQTLEEFSSYFASITSNTAPDKELKDPVTKVFFEYHHKIGDYQLCINYDKTGRQCYTSEDFQF